MASLRLRVKKRTLNKYKYNLCNFSLNFLKSGYGHSTPQTVLGKTFCMIYAMIGIPLCLVMFQSVGERLNYFASFCIQLFKKCVRFRNTEVNQTEMVCVAALIAIFVITGGAAMFSHYEGWTYFNSFYYCVITLTTIGFGDYVVSGLFFVSKFSFNKVYLKIFYLFFNLKALQVFFAYFIFL